MEKITYTNTEGEQIFMSAIPPYRLVSKAGFGSVENAIISQSNYEQDGETFVSSSLDVRNIELEGKIIEIDHASMLQLRSELVKTFNPKLTGTIVYENNIGTYQIDVIPELAPTFNESAKTGIGQPFLISLKALDPYFTDKSEIDSEIPMARIEPLFSFPLNITNTFEFAQLIAGDVIEIQNNGHVSVGAVFTINVNGPLVNPRIYNVITQEYFAFKGTFMTGTKLRISTVRGKKKVEQNDGSGWYNITTKRKVESKFLQIDRGINYLQLQADSGVKFTTSYIKFEPKILGV